MSEYALAGLGVIVPALGSLILGLAIEAGVVWPRPKPAAWPPSKNSPRSNTGAPTRTAETRRHKHAEDVAESARFMVLCRT